jgi:DNA-binding PadR family transcriptional regulator
MVMHLQQEEWKDTLEDIEIFGINNKNIVLKNVPVRVSSVDKTSVVDIKDVIKAEQEYMAGESKLDPKDLPILTLLYAKINYSIKIGGKGLNVEQGQIKQSIRFQKMLFYLWIRMRHEGYGNMYPHLTFYPDIYGPASKEFKTLINELKEKGLVKAEWGINGKSTSVFTLTDKGMGEAAKLWNQTPDVIQKLVLETKDKLTFITEKDLIEVFHKLYPEYKRDRDVQKFIEEYKEVETALN